MAALYVSGFKAAARFSGSPEFRQKRVGNDFASVTTEPNKEELYGWPCNQREQDAESVSTRWFCTVHIKHSHRSG